MVVGENVPHLARLNGGAYLSAILKEFEEVGYHFDLWELYAPDFGVPQSRRRLFFIGIRDDLPGFPHRPVPTVRQPVTIAEALADLEGVDDETVPNQSQFFVSSKATSGGGQGDHKNDPDKVSYCIRANARGRIQFHHRLDRRLTVRECARLQTFPDEFVFPFTTQRNLTLIGNAVPPVLGYSVAKSVLAYLDALENGAESTASVSQIVRPSAGVVRMRDDKELVESFLGPIRECAEYRPAFGHSDSAGVDLQGFLDLYGGDPFYAWIGLDTPLVYAAHKAAGGLTSVYRQIGVGTERLLRDIMKDALGLSSEQTSWKYEYSKGGGKKGVHVLDAKIAFDDLAESRRTVFREWLSSTGPIVALSNKKRERNAGGVFENRKGYKIAIPSGRMLMCALE